ncbi:HlyD family secretion protein [Roseobacteraceae bacterium S113]
MLELIICSLFTILPDYLLRRRFQGKRFGQDITFFTVWYELRYGITGCAMLTISLFTIVFYFHPSTSDVNSFFRTVTILSDTGGRVEEVYVTNNQDISAGDPIFRLNGDRQEAAAETARRQIAEIDAALTAAETQRASAVAAIAQAEAQLRLAESDLGRIQSLIERGSSATSERDLEQAQAQADAAQATLDAAQAGLRAADANINVQLPASRASAEAAFAQAQTEIEKLTVYAGVDGRVEQFTLRRGDIVNPVLRPAGILVPSDAGRNRFVAGFPQVTAQVIKKGGVAEIACVSKPFTIVPMVIVEVQDVIAAGQVRPSDKLGDAQRQFRPGTVTAFLEPLYPGQADGIPPGSRCLANAYTDNHHRLEHDEDLGTGARLFLHVVDTVGVIHAAGLRIRSLLMPLTMLVFTGH